MAREIVITSVPRGVKIGRTGFQVAMQTAGLRDDLAAVLEKMAGYRHLPAGHGANPICYFHRLARTVAGQVHVVGRIVDAGVDFSHRSNKLAHMVILDPADLGQVAASSPAAVLAAVEGRLATTWTGGPEERQAPFGLAGIPASLPAPCGTWQQVMGDAGWAGVIAERALRNQPTLVIGPDSSPASCRRLLTLFQEALAVVPPARRWAVTFDTTTLAPDGILWRGTFAGSPESQATQPGLLVVDLSRPQPIPLNMAAGDLVKVARTGQGAAVPRPTASVGGDEARPGSAGGRGATAPGGATGRGGPMPPPPPENGDEWEEIPLGGRRSRSGGGVLALAIAAIVLVLLVAGGVGVVFAWKAVARVQALQRIKDYADADGKEKAAIPTADDVRTALAMRSTKSESTDVEKHLEFLNAVLAADQVTAKDVEDGAALRNMLGAVVAVMTTPAANSREAWPTLLGKNAPPGAALDLLANIHPAPFPQYDEFRALADDCGQLVTLPAKKEGEPRVVTDRLWNLLVASARADKVDRDYDKAREPFARAVAAKTLEDPQVLIDTVRKKAPERTKPDQQMEPQGGTAQAEEGNAAPKRDPLKAFTELQRALTVFRDSKKTVELPQPGKPIQLFSIDTKAVSDLEVDVVAATKDGFTPRVEKDGDKKAWKILVDNTCLAVVEITDQGNVTMSRGEAKDDDWEHHRANLRFMPIGFRRPGKSMGEDDWIVLSQPDSVQLQSDQTLRDLLCGEPDFVPLPKGDGWPEKATAEWKSRTLRIGESPLQLTVTPRNGGKQFSLGFTAKIDDRDYSLVEQLTVGQQVRRNRSAWPERPMRFREITRGTGDKPDANRNRIAIRKGKAIRFDTMDHEDATVPVLIQELLKECDFADLNPNEVKKQVIAPWCGVAKLDDKNYKLFESLRDWGDILRNHVASGKFGGEQNRRFEQENPPPPKPEAFKEPERGKDESDDAYQARVGRERKEHAAKQSLWLKWVERCDGCKDAATKDPERLREYLDAHPKPGDKETLDPEIAAICVLLELDGLIVAKAYREELDELLPQIPIAALFEGEASDDWTLEIGTGKSQNVRVPVARLVPAEPRKQEPATAAPTPPSP